MGIGNVRDSDFEGLILDTGDYGDKINRVEIPHERANLRNAALTEAELSILRSELWKLIWISRIARPGAIYEASTAAQAFNEGGNGRLGSWKGRVSESRSDRKHTERSENGPERMPGFRDVSAGSQSIETKANLPKKIKRSAIENTFMVRNLVFWKCYPGN